MSKPLDIKLKHDRIIPLNPYDLHKLSTNENLKIEEKTNIYNQWADSYNLYVKNQYYTAPGNISRICLEYLDIIKRNILDTITNKSNLKINVLDFGCGTGLLGKSLNKNIFESNIINNNEVILNGVDISNKMIEKSLSLDIYKNLICCDLTNANQEDLFRLLNLNSKIHLFISCGVFLEGHVSLDFIFKISYIVKSNGYLIFTVRQSFLDKFPKFFKQINNESSLSLEKVFDIPYLKDVNAICVVLKKIN